MADNTTLNAGSGGDVIRSEDRSGIKTQIVGLDLNPNGTESLMAGALPTTPNTVTVSATSAGLTTATTNYAIGDRIGDELSWANAVRTSGGMGLILGATLTSAANATPNGPIDLYLYSESVAMSNADNGVYGVADADVHKNVGIVQFPAGVFNNSANGSIMSYLVAPLPFHCAATTLYGHMVARGAVNFFTAVTDIQIRLYIAYLT